MAKRAWNSKELPEDELAMRSLLMRLYHSRQLGEPFYHANFVNGEAPGLEAKGWIERHGDGWRLTDVGMTGWCEMNRHVFDHDLWYGGSLWDEMREWLQKKGAQPCAHQDSV